MRGILNRLKKLFRYNIIIIYLKRIRFYYLPNIHIVCSDRVSITKTIKFNQITRFTGCGKIKIGDNCTFGYKPGGFYRGAGIEIQARGVESLIIVGNNVFSNNNVFICSSGSIEIGDNTLIGQNVTMMDFEAHGILPDKRRTVGQVGTIKIGQNVWIGNNVVILKNSKIGNNVIVAAGAIVTGRFPDDVIIGGVPAKIIKNIPFAT